MPKSETDALIADLQAMSDADFAREVGTTEALSAERKEALIQETVERANDCVRWNNDKYQVSIFEAQLHDENWPEMWHLSIKRHDRYPVFNWRDIQTVKNELIGVENEAVQLFPAESRLVDGANQYHLFVLKDPGLQFPFGFTNRMVTERQIGKSKNRKFASG